MKAKLTTLVLLGMTLTACGTRSLPREVPAQEDRITQVDFDGTDYTTAFDAVRYLRPDWLTPTDDRARPGSPDGYPRIVLGGASVGGVTQLLAIHLKGVKEIRFLKGDRAVAEFGPDFAAGVIAIEPRYGDGLPE